MAYDEYGNYIDAADTDPYKYADWTMPGDGGTTSHTYDPATGQETTNWTWDNGDPWAPTPTGHPTPEANFNPVPAPPPPPPPTSKPTPPPPPPPSGGGGNSGGSGGGGGGGGGTSAPSYASIFTDPSTQFYEGLAGNQLSLYIQQQAAMQAAVQKAEQTRAAQAAAYQRLQDYMNQRITSLQGPAYTGAEGEVLRTQMLDPIERDRTAAKQRALEQISARGMDPSSGIAQELLRQVDQAFDEYRAKAQGGIAQRQITEQRSRDQEAQQLMQALALLPDAMARGDLGFLAYAQGLINQPGVSAVTLAQALAQLPSDRLNDALAVLGVAPNTSNTSANAIQLLQQQQQQRLLQQQIASGAWGTIGQILPSFFGA